jgi:hypothetical protein
MLEYGKQRNGGFTAAACDGLMVEMDVNRDGIIDVDEFASYFAKHTRDLSDADFRLAIQA